VRSGARQHLPVQSDVAHRRPVEAALGEQLLSRLQKPLVRVAGIAFANLAGLVGARRLDPAVIGSSSWC
jgi:hypothetical protein